MNVRKCEVVSLSMCTGAYGLTNKIKNNTTPEEFDQFINDIPGYDLSYGGRCGWNVLGTAANTGNVILVEHIVKIGEPKLLNMGNEFGMTPLFCAMYGEDLDQMYLVAKKLIDMGADINLAARYGAGDSSRGNTPSEATPLWACIERACNRRLGKYLICMGAIAIKLSQKGEMIKEELILEIHGKRLFLAAYFKPENNGSIINVLPKDIVRHIYCKYLF